MDKIVTRYPNKRPSDFVDGLNSWQAFRLDAGLAVKYSTLEEENNIVKLEAIINQMDNIIRASGSKVPKRKAYKSIIKKMETEEKIPMLEDIIRELSGDGTVLEVGLNNGGS